MEWYWYILLFFTSLYFLWSYIDGNKDYWSKRGINFCNYNMIYTIFFGHILNAQKEIYKAAKKDGFGGYFEFRRPILGLGDFDLIKNVLIKDFDHFVNRRAIVVGASNNDCMSKMLLTQEGQFWKNLRATLSPIFATGKIRRLFDTFDSCGDEFVEQIKKKGNCEIDTEDMLGKYTMSVIAKTVFGVDSRAYEDFGPGKENEFLKNSTIFNDLTPMAIIKFLVLGLFPKFGEYFGLTIFDHSIGVFFSQIIKRSMKEREENSELKNSDFLDLMLETRSGKLKEEIEDLSRFEKEAQLQLGSKSKIALSDEVITGNCILFLTAGFDTTKQALVWATFQLALNQEIQQKLYEELKNEKESNQGLSYEGINNLEYLNMFISEVLRKYPPAPMLERKCENDYEIEGKNGIKFTIPKGMLVGISTYGIHHDDEIYPEPEKFDPERFTSEAKNARNNYSYLPFGHGPRNCIGMRFALTEIKVALAHLVLNFQVTPTEKTDLNPKIKNNATMKPVGKIWLKFDPR